MALTNTDVFLVSDTGGTNYKISYADLIVELNADLSAGGVNAILRGATDATSTSITSPVSVPLTGLDTSKTLISYLGESLSSTGNDLRASVYLTVVGSTLKFNRYFNASIATTVGWQATEFN